MRVVFVVVGVLLGQPDEQVPVRSDFDGVPLVFWMLDDARGCGVKFRHQDERTRAAVLVSVPESIAGVPDAQMILVRGELSWRVHLAPLSWRDSFSRDLQLFWIQRATIDFICEWLWRSIPSEVPQ